MSLSIRGRLSAVLALCAVLCLTVPVHGQADKPVTFAAFKFDDTTLETQESGQDTASCVEQEVVADLNREFRQRPLLKYWQFQAGGSPQFPFLRLSIHWITSWNLGVQVVNPKGQPQPSVEESLFGPGEKPDPPSGCGGWKPLVLRALHRLVEKRDTELLKTLQSVPVTGIIKPVGRERATVSLPADSENDLFQRRFIVELLGPEKQGGEMRPCGTGKPMKLSAEVRLSPRSSTPPNVVPGFIAQRYTPFAVYLTGTCDQIPEVSVVP